jgi:hypothetical protein
MFRYATPGPKLPLIPELTCLLAEKADRYWYAPRMEKNSHFSHEKGLCQEV